MVYFSFLFKFQFCGLATRGAGSLPPHNNIQLNSLPFFSSVAFGLSSNEDRVSSGFLCNNNNNNIPHVEPKKRNNTRKKKGKRTNFSCSDFSIHRNKKLRKNRCACGVGRKRHGRGVVGNNPDNSFRVCCSVLICYPHTREKKKKKK